jgi:hypothetical protein
MADKEKKKRFFDILDLGKRISLVTGAGQGVGRQIALQRAFTGRDSGK